MRLLSHLLAFGLLIFSLFITPADAADLTVARVISGDMVVLSDNTQVRLYGIQAPQAATKDSKAWPLFKKARDHLEKLTAGKSVTLRPAPSADDRYGRRQAEVLLPDGESLQVAMLKAGLARVYTMADNPAIATQLYPVENKARAAKLGIWALPAYAVQTPDTIAAHIDRFQIVEGTVQDVASVGGVLYLNFGADWRTDFTVAIPDAIAERSGAEALKGQRIRVRGWAHSKNGPMIGVTHPEQIELLETSGVDAAAQ